MGAIIVYILKSSLCLALFYLFFKWLMSKEAFFRLNRFLLLAIMLLSMTIPVIEITVSPARAQVVNTDIVTPNSEEMQLSSIYINSGEINNPTDARNDNILNIIFIFSLIYLAGIIFMLGRFLFMYIHLFKLFASKNMRKIKEEKYTIYIHDRDIIPMSWMNRILISEIDYRENGTEIIAHEAAHISKKHSYDLILTELFVIIHWFNPAAWLMRRELKAIHEYQADKAVIDQGIDARSYQLLLIKKAVGDRLYSIANSFNHSKLKNRITMITVKKSKNRFALKALFIVPLSMIAIIAFASNQVVSALEPISEIKVNDFITEEQDALEKEFTVVSVKESKSDTLKPLYVIDGKILENVEVNSINPDEIESISVLKGKAAVSLYGKEAENGVIVIQTKNAVKEDSRATNLGRTEDGKRIVEIYTPSKKMTDTVIMSIIEDKTKDDQKSIEYYHIGDTATVYKISGANTFIKKTDKSGEELIELQQKFLKRNRDTTKAKRDGVPILSSSVNQKDIEYVVFEGVESDKVRMSVYIKNEEVMVGESSCVSVSVKDSDGRKDFRVRNFEPLYVIDGEIIENFSITKIDPNIIKNIDVLSSDGSVEQYGEKGKNGVIEITTKR